MNLAEREPNAIDAPDRELPEGWTQALLCNDLLTDLQSGFACGTNNRDSDGIGHLRPMNVNREGQVDLTNVKFVPKSEASREERRVRIGDIIFNNTNSAELVGKTAYYGDEEPRLFSNHMTRLRCNPKTLDSHYCALALHQKWREGYFAGRCNNHVSQASISSSVLLETPILLPPLAEQRRIVAKVEQLLVAANASRARLARVPTLLKRFRQAVLAAACSGRLTADWREQHPDVEPAAQLLARILAERRAKWEAAQVGKRGRISGKAGAHFVDIEGVTSSEGDHPTFNAVVPGFDGSVVEQLFRKQQVPGQAKYQEPAAPDTSELPDLPESWVWSSAEQVCETITKGTTPSSEKMTQGAGEIPYIKVYNLTFDGRLDFTNNPTFVNYQTHSHELSRSRVFPGDVLMNIVGPPLGKVSVVPNLFPEWNINQAIAFFRLLPGFDRSFLVDCLSTEWILSTISFRAKATAGQHNLTLEQCRSLPLPLPPVSEQQEIVCRVERLFKFADAVERRTATAAARSDRLTQAILAKAFRGELVPTEAELARAEGRNYEPASALLKRIQGPQEKIGLPPAGRNGSERNPIGRSV